MSSICLLGDICFLLLGARLRVNNLSWKTQAGREGGGGSASGLWAQANLQGHTARDVGLYRPLVVTGPHSQKPLQPRVEVLFMAPRPALTPTFSYGKSGSNKRPGHIGKRRAHANPLLSCMWERFNRGGLLSAAVPGGPAGLRLPLRDVATPSEPLQAPNTMWELYGRKFFFLKEIAEGGGT